MGERDVGSPMGTCRHVVMVVVRETVGEGLANSA